MRNLAILYSKSNGQSHQTTRRSKFEQKKKESNPDCRSVIVVLIMSKLSAAIFCVYKERCEALKKYFASFAFCLENARFFRFAAHEMVLLSIVKKIRRKEMEMRVLILGLDNSGKTTILQRINGEDYTKVAPTFGFNIKTLEFRKWKLSCWDIGGQSSLRSYWRNYFEQTDAVVSVVGSILVVYKLVFNIQKRQFINLAGLGC